MLSDSLFEFKLSMINGETLNRALTELRAEVVRYSAPFWRYDKFVTDALLIAIRQLRMASKLAKPEMLLRLLTMSELVDCVCGLGMGTDEELLEGLQLSLNGTRYKLRAITAEELKMIGAAPLDETDAREMPKFTEAHKAGIIKISTPEILTDKSQIEILLRFLKSQNNFTFVGNPLQPTC